MRIMSKTYYNSFNPNKNIDHIKFCLLYFMAFTRIILYICFFAKTNSNGKIVNDRGLP